MKNVRIAALFALSFGCMGSPAASPFLGTYGYTTGSTIHLDCGGGAPITMPLVGTTETITMGTGSELVKTDSNGCVLDFDVSASTATAVAGQSCTETSPMGTSTVTVATYTMTRAADGSIATAFTGTAATGGATCQLSGSGTLVLAH